jgi:hypothetical protein
LSAPTSALVLILAILVGGYWYGVNIATWSNPLYPSGLSVAGHELLKGEAVIEQQVGRPGLALLTDNLWDLLWEKMWDRHTPVTGQTEHGSGFGLLAAALGPPAMLALAFTRRRARFIVIVLIGMTLTLAGSVARDPWIGRFFSFLPLAAVPFIAALTPVLRGRIALGLWLALLVSTAGWSIYAAVQRSVPPIAASWFRQSGLVHLPPRLLDFTDYAYLIDSAAEVPPGETIVLIHARSYGPVARYHGPDLSRPLIYHDEFPGPYDVKAWKLAGLRWVMTGVRFQKSAEVDRLMESVGTIRVAQGLYVIP